MKQPKRSALPLPTWLTGETEPPAVHHFPGFTPEVAYALKALAAGEANAEQQRGAMEWILNAAADYQGFTFRDDPRHDAFAQGKRFVGQAIVTLVNMDPAKLAKLRGDHENG